MGIVIVAVSRGMTVNVYVISVIGTTVIARGIVITVVRVGMKIKVMMNDITLKNSLFIFYIM